jgi:hypothetical protein
MIFRRKKEFLIFECKNFIKLKLRSTCCFFVTIFFIVEIIMSTTIGPNTLNKIDFNIYAVEHRTDNAFNQTTPIFTCRLSNFEKSLFEIIK